MTGVPEKTHCAGSALYLGTEYLGAFWIVSDCSRGWGVGNATLCRCWIWVIILETWQDGTHQVWICVVLVQRGPAFVYVVLLKKCVAHGTWDWTGLALQQQSVDVTFGYCGTSQKRAGRRMSNFRFTIRCIGFEMTRAGQQMCLPDLWCFIFSRSAAFDLFYLYGWGGLGLWIVLKVVTGAWQTES